ncbi:FAD-binding domain-containing protein [Pisolithus marmoratus]|nr:FAD-binding domain-containing protein [Pisolithus marmoratus]
MIFFPSLSLLLATGAFATRIITDPRAVSETCETISAAVSFASAVHYSGALVVSYTFLYISSLILQDLRMKRTFVIGPPQVPAGDVFIRAGYASDIGIALQILGKDRVPFAVKGGGHTLNPGFSSTTGIQIAMSRFQKSVSGIGVAGFTLGGGYSWLTNQYGLALDNVESFELVLPNGTVIDGGYNNFGIVTKFVLNTYPQGQIWGGVMIYPETSVDQVTHATANFSASNDDPKAQMIMTTNYAAGNNILLDKLDIALRSTILFYDSPDPAPGVFDAFLGIPVLIKDLSRPDPINTTLALRGAFNTVTVTKYSVELIEAAINESIHWGQTLMAFSGVFTSYDFTPVMPTTLKRSSTSSAWPPTYKDAIIPIVLYIAWISESSDDVMHDMVRRSMSTLLEKAVSLGLDIMDAPLYSNCALFDTPIERMYGNNIERLRKIKNDVDPYSVMSLTGGFKF